MGLVEINRERERMSVCLSVFFFWPQHVLPFAAFSCGLSSPLRDTSADLRQTATVQYPPLVMAAREIDTCIYTLNKMVVSLSLTLTLRYKTLTLSTVWQRAFNASLALLQSVPVVIVGVHVQWFMVGKSLFLQISSFTHHSRFEA